MQFLLEAESSKFISNQLFHLVNNSTKEESVQSVQIVSLQTATSINYRILFRSLSEAL
jgi:hypothetical protein